MEELVEVIKQGNMDKARELILVTSEWNTSHPTKLGGFLWTFGVGKVTD